jgi:hypothetical protein
MTERSSLTRTRIAAGWRRLAHSWDFVGTVWLAIATVLICAMAPTGLPQTAHHGSAFNPATTVVAINSGGSARLLIKRTVRSESADAGEALAHDRAALLVPEAPAALPAPSTAEPPRSPRFAAAAAPIAHRARPWATGPPQA